MAPARAIRGAKTTVGKIGRYVLFGFLLTLPFTDRLVTLSHGQLDLKLATSPGALAIALVLNPSPSAGWSDDTVTGPPLARR